MSEAIKKTFSLKPVYWALLALYAALVLYGVSNHEPWRDEAQSWLLVRELSLADLFKILPAEGHPPLWYLTILPFAKLGLPYTSQGYITAVVMILAVFVLLFKTRLPVYAKIALLFSYFVFYEYAVVGRGYCLAFLFTMLVIACYETRFTKPWQFALVIIALFNTQMMLFTFAASIVGLYFVDAFLNKQWNKQVALAFTAMCIGGLYLIPYLVLSNPVASSFEGRITDHGEQISKIVGSALFTYQSIEVAIGSFILLVLFLLPRPKALAILIGGFAGMCYILGYKYVGAIRHQGMLFVIILGAYGIAQHYDDDAWTFSKLSKTVQWGFMVLTATLLMQISTGVQTFMGDLNEEFSGAKGASEYINEARQPGSIIVGHPSYSASAIAPFLEKGTQIYYPDCQRFGNYLIYDSCFLKNMFGFPADYAAITAMKNFTKNIDKVILVVNAPLQQQELLPYWKLEYQTTEQPIHKDEAFFIYKYSGPLPLVMQ